MDTLFHHWCPSVRQTFVPVSVRKAHYHSALTNTAVGIWSNNFEWAIANWPESDTVWIHWTIVRPKFNKNAFWVNFEAQWNENESECETSGQKKIQILSDSIIIMNDIQEMAEEIDAQIAALNEIMLGPSKMRTTWRACDGRYRQYGVWLWKGILFSIWWYQSLILFTTLRYWFKPIWTEWKIHSGSNLKSRKTKTKTKAKVGNSARSELDIVLYYHNQQQYSGYQNKWRRDRPRFRPFSQRGRARDLDLDLGWRPNSVKKNAFWTNFEVP